MSMVIVTRMYTGLGGTFLCPIASFRVISTKLVEGLQAGPREEGSLKSLNGRRQGARGV